MAKQELHSNTTDNGAPKIDNDPSGNRPRSSAADDSHLGGNIPYYKAGCNDFPGNECGEISVPADSSQAIMNYNAMNPIKLITLTIFAFIYSYVPKTPLPLSYLLVYYMLLSACTHSLVYIFICIQHSLLTIFVHFPLFLIASQ